MAHYVGTLVLVDSPAFFALEVAGLGANVALVNGDTIEGTITGNAGTGSNFSIKDTVSDTGNAVAGGSFYVISETSGPPYLTDTNPILANGEVVTGTKFGSEIQNVAPAPVALELVEAEANESIVYTEAASVVVSKAEMTESILTPHYDSGNVDRANVPALSVAKAETTESILSPHYDSGNVNRLNTPTFVFANAETNESISVLPAFYLIGAATTKYLRSPIIGII